MVRVRQSKIPPGKARGRKSALELAVMAALDAANLPLTALLNVKGDRVVMIARRPGNDSSSFDAKSGALTRPSPAQGATAIALVVTTPAASTRA